MIGKLYFVGTPIGNLGDITLRALETLKNVDYIACEDTRHSSILLKHYEINKPTFSYHKFNEKTASQKIISLIQSGKSVAVISDAGMPSISDPGLILAQKLVENNIAYEVIGGVSAVTQSLVGSGLDTRSFVFGGFLPDAKNERLNYIKKLSQSESTLIFYSADHDLAKDLNDLYIALGGKKVVVANDLTKKFEHFYRGNLGSLVIQEPKGEFVILIEGVKQENMLNNAPIEDHIQFYIDSGMSRMEALKLVAKDRGISKSQVYNQTVDKK